MEQQASLQPSLAAAQSVLLGMESTIEPAKHRIAHFILICAAQGDSERVRKILQLCWSDSQRRGAAYEIYRTMIADESALQERRAAVQGEYLDDPTAVRGFSVTKRKNLLLRVLQLLDHRFAEGSSEAQLSGSKADFARLIINHGVFGAKKGPSERREMQRENAAAHRCDFRKGIPRVEDDLIDENALIEARRMLSDALELTARFKPLVVIPDNNPNGNSKEKRDEIEERRLQTAQAMAGLFVYMTPEQLEKSYEILAPKAERRSLALEVVEIMVRRFGDTPNEVAREAEARTCHAILTNMDLEFGNGGVQSVADQLLAVHSGRIKAAQALAELIASLPNGALGCQGSRSQIQETLTRV